MTNWKGRENKYFWHSLGVTLVFMARRCGKPLKPCSVQLESRPFFGHGATSINH